MSPAKRRDTVPRRLLDVMRRQRPVEATREVPTGVARTPDIRRVLVAGWFTWDDCQATAGDLLARDVACGWIADAGLPFDVANHPRYGAGVDWRRADPGLYSDLVFVCGPLQPSERWTELARRFAPARKVGLDLTMIRTLATWNPFDVLFERDSDRSVRPDLAFAASWEPVPILGLMLVEPYPPEYPGRDMQDRARRVANALASSRPAACVRIDTLMRDNASGLRNPAEVESLVARMDAVITTRLHGLVLALKHGVPAIAIDPVAGGAKILRQAEAVGWPLARTADAIDEREFADLLDYCLSDEARELARSCAARAAGDLVEIKAGFIEALRHAE